MPLKLVLVLISVCSVINCASGKSIAMDVRPITVKIMDASTHKPLKGISIYYAIETVVSRKYTLFVGPNIEPDLGTKIIYKSHNYTDNEGVAKFNVRGLTLLSNERLSLSERIDMEFLFINLDVDMSSKIAQIKKSSGEFYYKTGDVRRDGLFDNVDVMHSGMLDSRDDRKQMFVVPNKKYKGMIVLSTLEFTQGNSDWTEPDDIFNVVYNEGSLKKENDLVEVFLKHNKGEMGIKQ